MNYTLMNALAVFQCFINKALGKTLNHYMFIYLDDILNPVYYASNIGVGAVLSQCSGPKGELHPCAYFSHWLTAPERNYGVGDCELLAIKLALEEWRHWLKGGRQPLLIFTDYKNLTYIQQAKSLNLRQARWSLFFTCFDFSLSFKPGLKNLLPDTLSCHWNLPSPDPIPQPIIPSYKIVATLWWGLEVGGLPGAPTGARSWDRPIWQALCSSVCSAAGSLLGSYLSLCGAPGAVWTLEFKQVVH